MFFIALRLKITERPDTVWSLGPKRLKMCLLRALGQGFEQPLKPFEVLGCRVLDWLCLLGCPCTHISLSAGPKGIMELQSSKRQDPNRLKLPN